jgi:hypothetical protein
VERKKIISCILLDGTNGFYLKTFFIISLARCCRTMLYIQYCQGSAPRQCRVACSAVVTHSMHLEGRKRASTPFDSRRTGREQALTDRKTKGKFCPKARPVFHAAADSRRDQSNPISISLFFFWVALREFKLQIPFALVDVGNMGRRIRRIRRARTGSWWAGEGITVRGQTPFPTFPIWPFRCDEKIEWLR